MLAAAKLLKDPLKFHRFLWPNDRLYAKQEEVLMSVEYNDETVVHAANMVGD